MELKNILEVHIKKLYTRGMAIILLLVGLFLFSVGMQCFLFGWGFTSFQARVLTNRRPMPIKDLLKYKASKKRRNLQYIFLGILLILCGLGLIGFTFSYSGFR